jgi:hypothetical protein
MGDQHHTPAALPPRKSRSAHCTETWASPRDSLGTCGEKKISYPIGVQTPNNPAVASQYNDYTIADQSIQASIKTLSLISLLFWDIHFLK